MSDILETFLANKLAIRKHLLRFTQRQHQIDDILQETFLRGFAAETRGEVKHPKAYLFQIAKNIALDKLRKDALVPMDSIEDSGGSSVILDDNQVMTDEWLDGRRKLLVFTEAVAQLPLRCREAFLMRYVEDYSYKQIANRMSISVSAVEKHVTTGLIKCDAYLRAKGYHPSEFGAAASKTAKSPRRKTPSQGGEDA